MLTTTCNAVREILRADPSITPTDRNRLLAMLRNRGEAKPTEPTPAEPRIVRRAEFARRMGVSLRAVDNWSRAGILEKVKLPGRVRAAGFRESDLRTLIEGKVTQ